MAKALSAFGLRLGVGWFRLSNRLLGSRGWPPSTAAVSTNPSGMSQGSAGATEQPVACEAQHIDEIPSKGLNYRLSEAVREGLQVDRIVLVDGKISSRVVSKLSLLHIAGIISAAMNGFVGGLFKVTTSATALATVDSCIVVAETGLLDVGHTRRCRLKSH